MNKKGELTGELLGRAGRIKLLLMDCDGVLTDGRLYYSAGGEELKAFHVHDGQGLVSWHRAGFFSGIITGRRSEILVRRAEELGIRFLRQGATNKETDFEEILNRAGVRADETAYIGDDIADLPLLARAGLSAAPADAVEKVLAEVDFVAGAAGGRGAVREVVELIFLAREG